jgi:N-acetylmuramoyl-L-alanine amidase
LGFSGQSKLSVSAELTDVGQNGRVSGRPRRIKPGWLILIALALWWLIWHRPVSRPVQSACAGDQAPTFDAPRELPNALNGVRVMLNPGHGLTLRDEGDWGFQRPIPDGRGVFVLEDDSNLQMARTVRAALVAAGATVDTTRELEENIGGTSGKPAWREAATHHLERVGAPRGVWNSEGEGLHDDCRAGQDLRSRAYFANLKRADLMISLHSNAGMPWARGTQVISGSRPYLNAPLTTAERSACMARGLADAVPDAIRRERPDLGWSNAETISSDRYGENGYALMPSVILEVGFHTNRIDGAALRQESFRRAVADGIVNGLKRFLENPACLP